jgi:hypothetical protein
LDIPTAGDVDVLVPGVGFVKNGGTIVVPDAKGDALVASGSFVEVKKLTSSKETTKTRVVKKGGAE